MINFQNKNVVITGGNSGIGLAAARQFKEAGAHVITNARSEQRRRETLEQFPELFDDVITADLSDLAQVRHFVESAAGSGIDVLFLNAGIAHFIPIDQVDEAHYTGHFDLNVKSLLFSVQYALPYLRTGASIITTTSVVNRKGMPNSSVYAATKAAVKSITQVLAIELAARNIRINAISPGPIDTPILDKMGLSSEEREATEVQLKNQVPLNRLGSSDEVASLVLQVAGNAYITGQELIVDGGLTAA